MTEISSEKRNFSSRNLALMDKLFASRFGQEQLYSSYKDESDQQIDLSKLNASMYQFEQINHDLALLLLELSEMEQRNEEQIQIAERKRELELYKTREAEQMKQLTDKLKKQRIESQLRSRIPGQVSFIMQQTQVQEEKSRQNELKLMRAEDEMTRQLYFKILLDSEEKDIEKQRQKWKKQEIIRIREEKKKKIIRRELELLQQEQEQQ
ncbi:MAG: hypothetical protein EZS28_016162 [Streblomastix strix]|uniref:Uncharacterized protein n=1 Tax=Streblomastix strix TaxID=222440 RepID=A0A5J4W0D9_9EUKA|nr:MAG: hypothetical protein EZS28_016162 [Streblomastix strix]